MKLYIQVMESVEKNRDIIEKLNKTYLGNCELVSQLPSVWLMVSCQFYYTISGEELFHF